MSAPSKVLAMFNDLVALGVPRDVAIRRLLDQLCELTPDELTELSRLMLLQAEFRDTAPVIQ